MHSYLKACFFISWTSLPGFLAITLKFVSILSAGSIYWIDIEFNKKNFYPSPPSFNLFGKKQHYTLRC